MAVEQLDVQRLGRFEIAVVDPVGRMLDERPEIIVEVQHQELQPLLLQPLGQLHRRRRLARRTRPADPHHADVVARVHPRDHSVRRFIQRRLVLRERVINQSLQFPAAHHLVQARDRIASMLAVPLQRFFHPLSREPVSHELRLVDRAFAQPVSAPAVTLVRVRRVLEAVTAQRVQHAVLDRLDGRGKIRDQVMRVRVQAQHHGVRHELRNTLIRIVGLKNLVVDAGQIILLKPANRPCRPQDGLAHPLFIERHQRPIAFQHLDDAVLDGHRIAFLVRLLYHSRPS